MLPGKDLDDAIAAGGDYEAAVLTPHHAADTLATHDAVRGDLLRANAFVERPETDRGVVTRRDGFTSVFAEGQGGDGGGVGQHAISALAC